MSLQIKFVEKTFSAGTGSWYTQSILAKCLNQPRSESAWWALWCCTRDCSTKETLITKDIFPRKSPHTILNKTNKKVGLIFILYDYIYSELKGITNLKENVQICLLERVTFHNILHEIKCTYCIYGYSQVLKLHTLSFVISQAAAS